MTAPPPSATTSIPGGGSLTIAVGSLSAFRLSVDFRAKDDTAALESLSLDPDRSYAGATHVHWGGMRGLRADFGALLVVDDGNWVLYDAANRTVLESSAERRELGEGGGAPPARIARGAEEDAVALFVDASPGAGSPCLGNDQFGSPFTWNRAHRYLAFAVPLTMTSPGVKPCPMVSGAA